jgi:hypothetical protein
MLDPITVEDPCKVVCLWHTFVPIKPVRFACLAQHAAVEIKIFPTNTSFALDGVSTFIFHLVIILLSNALALSTVIIHRFKVFEAHVDA